MAKNGKEILKILITGAAGFIGFHLSKKLLEEGYEIVGLDNINDYYSTLLKKDRLKELGVKVLGEEPSLIKSNLFENFSFIKADISDRSAIERLFREQNFNSIIHLAAQAGVRYSLENPYAYTSSNIEGFLNILEGCRNYPVKHLIYASSSSVYGMNATVPFNTSDQVDNPVSLYAATKKANELMAHTYAHLYSVPVTGLRFFTVYGPWGRPDMAYFKFANLMREGKSIEVYNDGKMSRDFTYIDDIIISIEKLLNKPPKKALPYQLFNIGRGEPVNLLEFIEILEKELGITAEKKMLPMQPGDVERTWADVTHLHEYIKYKPTVDLQEGISKFAEWYQKASSWYR